MSKYEPLWDWVGRKTAKNLTLTFAEIQQKVQLLLMKAGKPILKKVFGKITMSPRNTTKISVMASIRSTSKLMEKPCLMFA